MKSNKITTLTVQLTLAITAVIVVLFETDMLPTGLLTAYSSTDYILCMLMVIITLAVIPASFILFRQKRNRRCIMLAPVIMTNAVLYYLIVNVSYLYMAIITILCMLANWNNSAKQSDDTPTQSYDVRKESSDVRKESSDEIKTE